MLKDPGQHQKLGHYERKRGGAGWETRGGKGTDARDDPDMFAPRLSGRLTAELILRSPQYLNACGEYEVDLRGETRVGESSARKEKRRKELMNACIAGNKISAIENLGATEVSDNDPYLACFRKQQRRYDILTLVLPTEPIRQHRPL